MCFVCILLCLIFNLFKECEDTIQIMERPRSFWKPTLQQLWPRNNPKQLDNEPLLLLSARVKAQNIEIRPLASSTILLQHLPRNLFRDATLSTKHLTNLMHCKKKNKAKKKTHPGLISPHPQCLAAINSVLSNSQEFWTYPHCSCLILLNVDIWCMLHFFFA